MKLLSDSGFAELAAPPKVAAIAVTPVVDADVTIAFLLKSSAGAPPVADDDRRGLGFTVEALEGEAERG